MTLELVSHTVLVNGAPDRGPGQRVWTIPVAEDVLTSNASPIGVYPSTDADPPWGTWVGAAPHLSTADADTSYGQYTGSVAAADATRGVGIRNGPWTPTSGSTPASCVIEFQAWAAEPVRWSGFVQTNFGGTGSFAAGNITTAETAAAGWVTGSITLGFPSNSTIWGLFTSAVAAGNIITNLRAFLPSGSTLYAGDVRVSKLELKVTMNEEVFTPVPFGRTGCDLLPDGSYVVACYSDMQTLPDIVNVWKVASDGAILGHLVIQTDADTDGRAHVIALDGFLVQVLYPTGTYEGGMSYVVDCSDDVPVLVASFDDAASSVNAYGSAVHHLYLRGPGVVAVCHRAGTSLYRRGRHLISRTGADATGEIYGMFPHPDDPNKFTAWFSSGASDREFTAWEYTVTSSDGLLVEELGPFVPSDTIWWMVGGGNPYATMPIALQENGDSVLEVIEAGDPTNVLWSDPSVLGTAVAPNGEGLWSRADWAAGDLGETGSEYWVGGYPRLSTNDDDVSYGHIGPSQTPGTRILVTLPAVMLAPGQGLGMSARVRIPSWSTGYIRFNWYLATGSSDTPIASSSDGIYSYYPTMWQDTSVFFNYSPELMAALAGGTAVVWIEPPAGDTGPSDSYEIAYFGPSVGQGPQAINSDTISCQVGDSLDHFAFTHELWHEYGDYTAPTRSQYTARTGLVDNRTGTPVVEIVDLEYGATSAAGYPDDMNYVSLITGSMDITARNGEVVVSTCIVQQEGSTNYYAVVSWKLSTAEAGRARLSGMWGGAWRQGINNATGLLSLQTNLGMLPEASEKTGLDAPAHPAWMKTSQGWELIGRFVSGAPTEVAIEGEAWYDFSAGGWGGTGVAETANEYWVGTAPRLSTVDETSYAHTGPSATYMMMPVARLAATPCPEGSAVRITARVRLASGMTPDPYPVELMIGWEGGHAFGSADPPASVPVGDWTTVSATIPWAGQIEYWAPQIEDGSWIAMAWAGNTGPGESIDVAWVKVEVIPSLGEPAPPATVDVTYQLSSINTDLASAITLAGASFTQYGNTWGPLVTQAGGPPSAASLADGSDATATTLANVSSNTSSQPVEVFTARLIPDIAVPPGASPVAVAFTLRGRAASGDAGSYLDLNIGTGISLQTVRAQGGNYQLQLAANLGPDFVTSSYGIFGRYASVVEHPGRFTTSGYTQGQSLATALAASDEGTAQWWAGKLAMPEFYIVVQNALTNPAHGPVELAEMSLTMRYLMP